MFALNERRERSVLLTGKIELMVESYIRWVDQLANWPKTHFDLFYLDRDAGRDRLDALWHSAELEYSKCRTLQKIYLPDENEPFQKVVGAYADFIQFALKMREASIRGEGAPPESADMIQETQKKILAASFAGKVALYEAARRHVHAPFIVRLPARKSS